MGLISLYEVYGHLIANALIYALAGLSLYFSLRCGVFNLSTPGIMAVAAYIAGLLTLRSHIPWEISIICGVIGSTIVGVLLAVPVLRLRGHFLGIATLSFIVIVQTFATNLGITGGSLGLMNIPVTINNLELIVILAAVIYIAYAVGRSRVGRAWDTIRVDESLARSAGIDVTRYKLIAFTISTVLAGLAGCLWAFENYVLVPNDFGFSQLTQFLVYVFLGGALHPLGAVIGSLIITTLPQWFSSIQEYAQFIVGALLIVTIVYFPDGLVGVFLRLVRRAKGRHGGRTEQSAESNGPKVQYAPTQVVEGVAGPESHSLVLQGVSKNFGGVQALSDVSFQVRSGEVVALIGPNGAGKTTIVNCISGLIPPSGGSVQLDGRDISKWPAHRIASEARIRRIFQASHLLPTSSMVDNVLVGYHAELSTGFWSAVFRTKAERSAERRARAQAQRALALVGLTKGLDVEAGQLAYGYRRRLEVARALVADPDIVMLDEPCGGLSDAEVEDFKALTRLLAEEGRKAVLLIEHNVKFVMDVADRIVILNFGEKIAEDVPEKVRRDPRVIEVYLGKQREVSK